MSELGPISAALQGELRQRVQQNGIIIWLDRDGHLWQGEQATLMAAGSRPGWRYGSGCMNPAPLYRRFRGLFRRLSVQSGPELAESTHREGRRHAR